MAENEQLSTSLLPSFSLFLSFIRTLLNAPLAFPLPSPARLSTLRRFSRLGGRCSRASTEDRACVSFAAAIAHACMHGTHGTARNETQNNPAHSVRPFCRTALSPRRYVPYIRGVVKRGEAMVRRYEGTSRTARLKNRRKRIVTCLSADVHRHV